MERILIYMNPELLEQLENVLEINAKNSGEPRSMSSLVRRALYFYLNSLKI